MASAQAFRSFYRVAGLAVLTVSVFSGSSADQRDLVQLSHDPYTVPPAQHATEVEPVMVAHGDTIVSAFQVGRFFGAGSDNIGWATSKDGGKSWTNGFLSGTTTVVGGRWHSISLPTVAFDRKHNVYLIAMMPFDGKGNGRGILVSRSADGFTWGAPIKAASTSGANGHWFACDNGVESPYYGNCYDAYLDYSSGTTVVNALVVSKDGGVTWSAPVSSPDQAAGLPSSIAIQPNGHFVVLGRGAGVNGDQQYAIPSVDGGHSLQATVDITTQQFDYPWLRADPNVSSAVDSNGTIYVVFADCRFRTNCIDPGCRFQTTTSFCATNDLVLTTSRNGVDWSALRRIPIDGVTSSFDHLIPGLGVLSREDGAYARDDHPMLALTYYYVLNANLPDGMTCTSSTCLVSAGFISSDDGGQSWHKAQQVSDTIKQSWLVPTSAGEMVADYISAIFVGGKPYGTFAIAQPPNPTTGAFDEAIYGEKLSEGSD